MKRLLFLLLFLFPSNFQAALDAKIKVLHLTFHEGCKYDFEDVANELGLDLTTWFVQHLPQNFWEGFAAGNEIYNVSYRRALRIWNLHHEFFNQFDAIITSDTAPLSRIFLQNNWQKPLIIWVCNRFDYAHGNGGEDRFPDREYYDLIKKATTMSNVRIVSYTPFEYEYARRKGINIGTKTIKPLGKKEEPFLGTSSVPTTVNKAETLFVFPRLTSYQIQKIIAACTAEGVPAWSGVYNGPEDLKEFKGVIFFPYNFSNLALFENLQRGIIHFVPTQEFLTRLGQMGIARTEMRGNLPWCEWYFEEYKDYFVFFNSWQELREKMATTDYTQMRHKVKAFGEHHRNQMVAEWRTLFEELTGRQI